MQIINEVLADGIRCLSLPESRFKTNRLSVAMLLPLNRQTASAGALLPYLLRRSCAAYPDYRALQNRLNELYGASITAEVARVGEAQALVLTAVSIDDRFALAGESVAEDCADLLRQMLFEPVLENGIFRSSDVETEKRCLIERMHAEINDKRWYARRRCEEILCENEAYAVDRYGSPESAAALTPGEITAAWRRVLAGARVQLILQGGAAAMHAAGPLREAMAGVPGRKPLDCPTDTMAANPRVRDVTERMRVNGSKLVMGFRTGTAEPDGDVAAARLMNALFGGTPHSLLFRHVREKLSLCYYCSSAYDRLKGVLLVESGVDERNAGRAREEILRQLDAVKKGDFSQEDLESARISARQSFEAVEDSQSAQAAWYLGQCLLPGVSTPEEASKALADVTKERVVAAAERLRLESIYLLAQDPHEEGTGNA